MRFHQRSSPGTWTGSTATEHRQLRSPASIFSNCLGESRVAAATSLGPSHPAAGRPAATNARRRPTRPASPRTHRFPRRVQPRHHAERRACVLALDRSIATRPSPRAPPKPPPRQSRNPSRTRMPSPTLVLSRSPPSTSSGVSRRPLRGSPKRAYAAIKSDMTARRVAFLRRLPCARGSPVCGSVMRGGVEVSSDVGAVGAEGADSSGADGSRGARDVPRRRGTDLPRRSHRRRRRRPKRARASLAPSRCPSARAHRHPRHPSRHPSRHPPHPWYPSPLPRGVTAPPPCTGHGRRAARRGRRIFVSE